MGAILLAAVAAEPALADDLSKRKVETVVVTGAQSAASQAGTAESISADEAGARINAINTEDMLKYFPSILVRKRHIGDTQDPIATRTTGVGASARSLIYADGILLSTLLGNNNTNASPHWGMVAAEDIAKVDVMYGPFSARYPGNSVGAVIAITTRMPEGWEMRGKAQSAFQTFDQYATHGIFSSYQLSAGFGDRVEDFSFRLSANHLDSYGQPLSFVMLKQPATASAGGVPVSGALSATDRTGAPVAIIGAGGLEHQLQENVTLKLAYDFGDHINADFTLALFSQSDAAKAESYLRETDGRAIYAGNVNIGGYEYAIGASAFANGVYRLGQTHLAQGVSLRSEGSEWEWRATLSHYGYARDKQRAPSLALPDALAGGAGTISRMDGTGWFTADVLASQHGRSNDFSMGAHYDLYVLSLRKYKTADWIGGDAGALASASLGKTETFAAWAEDIWHMAPEWNATIGGRFEHWRAFGGRNFSLAPPLDVTQPELTGAHFSPKASITWQADENWSVRASYGRAFRMPTVMELYQTVTTGSVLFVPNPDLNPERADAFELAVQQEDENGRWRVSFFAEDLADALISQSAPLPEGSGQLFNFVQNVERARAFGVETAFSRDDVFFDGLTLSGSLTFVHSRIVEDRAFPAAEGKRTPQIPAWRANLVATYRPGEDWALTLAARYSDRSFGTIDNSDIVSHTWQGFEGYFVLDARARYNLDGHWSIAAGIDNLNNRNYFIFHPFPQRTFLLELKYE